MQIILQILLVGLIAYFSFVLGKRTVRTHMLKATEEALMEANSMMEENREDEHQMCQSLALVILKWGHKLNDIT